MRLTNAQIWAIVSLCLVLTIDLIFPLGVAVGVLYFLCFFIASREDRKTILVLAFLIPVLILVKFFIFYSPDVNWMALANRVISILVILLAALMALRHRKLFEETTLEREQYIQQLEAVNYRLNAITQAMDTHLMISMTDSKGTITYVNRNFCRVSKYSEEELRGKNHRILKSGEHSEAVYTSMWNTISKGKPWSQEMKNRAKDGSFFWSNTIILPFGDSEKNISQYLAIRIPTTDQKLLEENREEYVQSLEKILHEISHKLRSPIATCLGLTELMAYRENPTPEVIDLAIEHRKTCGHDLNNFAQSIAAYINEQTNKN